MMVRYRAKAIDDIAAIYSRLSAHGPEVAEATENAIFAATELLGLRPFIGAMTNYANVRRWPMPAFQYTIFYRISSHDYVDVLRVVHGRRVRNLGRPPR